MSIAVQPCITHNLIVKNTNSSPTEADMPKTKYIKLQYNTHMPACINICEHRAALNLYMLTAFIMRSPFHNTIFGLLTCSWAQMPLLLFPGWSE